MSKNIEKDGINWSNGVKIGFWVAVCILAVFPFTNASLYAVPLDGWQINVKQELVRGYQQPFVASKKITKPKRREITLQEENVPLLTVLKHLAKKARVGISYQKDIIPEKRITVHLKDVSVYLALAQILKGTRLKVVLPFSRDVLVIKRKPTERKVQQETVTGTVTDAQTGDPMIGVNILVVGTSTGTVTNTDGHYSLAVPSLQDTLRFSFIGYATKSVPISGRTQINVQLTPKLIQGEQLVVVGYGTQQKQNVTGAIAEVDMQGLQSQPTGSAVKALQGQASGVTVISSGMPGQPPLITIRGANSFGDNSPLYVVDGVPTKSIASLSPNVIASMNVLKGAAAASIYGSRASNGVIVITTKKGQKGNVQVSYNAYGGFSVPPGGNPWNIANSKQQMMIMVNAVKNAGGDWKAAYPQFYDKSRPNKPHLPLYIDPTGIFDANDPAVDPSRYNVNPNYTDPSAINSFYDIIPASRPGTNWFQELFSPGAIMNQSVNVSGGGDIGNYLFALNYFHNAGNISNQFLKRYSIRANTNFKIGDNIQIGENLAYHITNNPTVSIHSEGGPLGMAMRQNPIIPVHDIMGNYAGTIAEGLGNAYNPLFLAYANRNNHAQTNRLFGNIFAKIDMWKNRITLKTSFGGNYNHSFSHSFNYPDYARSENQTLNSYSRSSGQAYSWTFTNTATYRQSFEGNNLKVLVGMEAHKNKFSGQGGSITDFFSFDPSFVSLSSGSGTKGVSSYHGESTLFSLFARVNYNYKQRYLISATIRRDGSSKFLNDRYGIFPAGSIGWRISNEPFFHVSWIDNLMLRAGYGIMGNQLNVNANNPYTLFSNSVTNDYYAINGSNNNNVLGFAQSSIGNPAAHWEKDKNFNVGINAQILNGKLTLKASYYQKNIEGLLYNPSLPGTAGGANPPFVNIGKMSDKGIDISLGTVDNISRNLEFNARATFTTYNNEIKKISLISNFFSQAFRRFNGAGIVRNAVGHAISSFYGYKVIGFWNEQSTIDKLNSNIRKKTGNPKAEYQIDAAPGYFRYADVNGDGRITTEDRTFIGNPNPDFTYGLNIGLKYKGFDFSMFWYGSQGNDIWNQTKYYHDFMAHFSGSKSKALLADSWTPQNHNASLPINTTENTFSNGKVPSSYFVENGSYLRLRNVEIGYTLPNTFLQGTGIQKLRFYIKAANLLTITPYSGVDPAVGYDVNTDDPENGGSSTAYGIDSGTYPTMRKYLIGINLSF